jgi:uncharacterized phage infection (PIP) family protein YhgE
MRTPLVLTLSLAALITLPGCIVGEIRDGLNLANENMVNINESINRVELHLGEIQETQLAELQIKLERIKTIDESLVDIDEGLGTVKVSLQRLDEHLTSLRKTLQNIDKTIPFLSLADDEEVTDAPESAPGAAPAVGPDGQPIAPEASGTQQQDTNK